PFFTTKPEGQGTGLGLATVYGIVQQHKGCVHVTTTPGVGATFDIYFPKVERTAPRPEDRREVVLERGTETILVAEDEENVRKLAQRILEEAGYTVLTASDGEQALDVFRREEDRIDLVILDAVMPRRSGRSVFEEIRRTRADMPVLFCSGYSSHTLEGGYLDERNLPLLQKPYGPRDLLQKIRQLLDAGELDRRPLGPPFVRPSKHRLDGLPQ
ncbi:response regulator, partial [bacterium]|nr:response regulator [bacterium]